MPRSRASYQQKAAYCRALRARYREAGLCIQCGLPSIAFVRCLRCRLMAAKANNRYWYRNRPEKRRHMREFQRARRARLKHAA